MTLPKALQFQDASIVPQPTAVDLTIAKLSFTMKSMPYKIAIAYSPSKQNVPSAF